MVDVVLVGGISHSQSNQSVNFYFLSFCIIIWNVVLPDGLDPIWFPAKDIVPILLTLIIQVLESIFPSSFIPKGSKTYPILNCFWNPGTINLVVATQLIKNSKALVAVFVVFLLDLVHFLYEKAFLLFQESNNSNDVSGPRAVVVA